MSSITPPQMDLGKLIQLIAHTVDLVGEDDYYHGRRVGIIAARLGEALGFSPQACCYINRAGLLHDCGVSSTRVHRKLLNAMEWEGAQQHCERGYALLKGYPPLASFADIVRHHHTRWEALQQSTIGEADALFANLIFLADRIDVLCAPFYEDISLLAHTRPIREVLTFYRGSMFAPQLVDAFLDASLADGFWMPLMSAETIQMQQESISRVAEPQLLCWEEVREGARIIGQIVDAKSHFTYQHSEGVASLSGYLARKMGLSKAQCEMVEVAGFLHDIGKLYIPDEILESQGALDEMDWARMRTHSFMTFSILREVGELSGITRWAAYHHERLDGAGYPFRLLDGEIPLEARIVSVADVYQALAQNRPYRRAWPEAEIHAMLSRLAEDGKLDKEVVAVVNADHEGVAQAALAE